jgi:hypothetical protein
MAEFRMHMFICVLLGMGIICIPPFYSPQSYQNIPITYQNTQTISDGLKAYANFTGKQFLIINHDAFDWRDVTVAVHARQGPTPVIVDSVDPNEIIFASAVPRIRAGEMYTLQTRRLTAQTSLEAQALPTQAYSLRILGAAPWGPGSWDGHWEQIASRVP